MLCLGPLSTNIIDVVIEYSEIRNCPLVLVASRRQIDSKELGSGYVNNWSTEEFVEYVRSKKSSNIFLERDHGGPWQGNFESNNSLNVPDSINAAKKSFEADILSGFQIIHIDPTQPIGNETLTDNLVKDRLFELYGHVCEFALTHGKEIAIEVGTEEQSGGHSDPTSFAVFLEEIKLFCNKHNFPMPLFTVLQTGTKVLELKNVGRFEVGSYSEKKILSEKIISAAELASKYGIYLKEHNSDYLSLENLKARPQLNIRGANVAPELGYIETKTILKLFSDEHLKEEYNKFVDIVVKTKKWEKWTNDGLALHDLQKAYIAGHYCYSQPDIIEIKEILRQKLITKNINLDALLRASILQTIEKYADAFGLTS